MIVLQGTQTDVLRAKEAIGKSQREGKSIPFGNHGVNKPDKSGITCYVEFVKDSNGIIVPKFTSWKED